MAAYFWQVRCAGFSTGVYSWVVVEVVPVGWVCGELAKLDIFFASLHNDNASTK